MFESHRGHRSPGCRRSKALLECKRTPARLLGGGTREKNVVAGRAPNILLARVSGCTGESVGFRSIRSGMKARSAGSGQAAVVSAMLAASSSAVQGSASGAAIPGRRGACPSTARIASPRIWAGRSGPPVAEGPASRAAGRAIAKVAPSPGDEVTEGRLSSRARYSWME